MFVKVSEYKGKPVICLMRDKEDRYPFSFGVQKAKLIIPAIEHIKAFIAKYDKPLPDSSDEAFMMEVD
jgi:hypothetical protein